MCNPIIPSGKYYVPLASRAPGPVRCSPLDPGLRAGRARAWRVVPRAERTDGFVLHPMLPTQLDNPGFFQGTAGIGYELLRMVRPDLLPSVLLWE